LINTDVVWRRGKRFQLDNSGPILVKTLSSNGQRLSDPMSLLKLGENMTEKDVVIEGH